MNVGDTVRMVHGQEQGVIRKIINDKMIEVEIEDGFLIPVLKKEVTIIAKEESSHFRGSTPPPEPKKEAQPVVQAEKGIFLAFTPVNDQQLSVHFINNTDYDLLVTIDTRLSESYQGLLGEKIEKKSSRKFSDWFITNFENWPELEVLALYFQQKLYKKPPLLTKKIKFKANNFFKSKQKISFLQQEGYLFQLDQDNVAVDPQKLKENFFKLNDPNTTDSRDRERSEIIDLHIEKILPEHEGLTNAEILNYQLDTFEKKLDNAIAMGLDEVIFIHGVGNGTLRHMVHKKLSQYTNIKFYKDSMREKFGYGATLVKIK